MATRAQPLRRDDQPAFVLHTFAYRETSVIVEAFTAEYGRVAMVARGARRPRSELRGLLQGFQPLLLSWSGQQELKTLLHAEWRGGLARIGGSALVCGFYLNELLLKLLPREDPHPRLFACYESALADLAAGMKRRRCCGASRFCCSPSWAMRCRSRARPTPAARSILPRVTITPSIAVRATHRPDPIGRWPVVRGATLLALADGRYADAETAAEAKRLMREVLDHYLEQRGVESRRVVQELQALDTRLEQEKNDRD
jgi:DNA repair protein RecO (recombination protein O)